MPSTRARMPAACAAPASNACGHRHDLAQQRMPAHAPNPHRVSRMLGLFMSAPQEGQGARCVSWPVGQLSYINWCSACVQEWCGTHVPSEAQRSTARHSAAQHSRHTKVNDALGVQEDQAPRHIQRHLQHRWEGAQPAGETHSACRRAVAHWAGRDGQLAIVQCTIQASKPLGVPRSFGCRRLQFPVPNAHLAPAAIPGHPSGGDVVHQVAALRQRVTRSRAISPAYNY